MTPQPRLYRAALRREIWQRSQFGLAMVFFLTFLAVFKIVPKGMLSSEGDSLVSTSSYGVLTLLAVLIAVALTQHRDGLRRFLMSLPCPPLNELHARLQVGLLAGTPLFFLLLAINSPFTPPEATQVAALAACFFGMLVFMVCLTTTLAHYGYGILFFLILLVAVGQTLATMGWPVSTVLLALLGYSFASWQMGPIYRGTQLSILQLSSIGTSIWAVGFSILLLRGEWSTIRSSWYYSLLAFQFTLLGPFDFQDLVDRWKDNGWSEISFWEVSRSVVTLLCNLINGAFLIYCSVYWLRSAPPLSSLLASLKSRANLDDYLLSWILIVSVPAPLFSGYWASRIAAAWSRQVSLLKRLPPRPQHVAWQRFRELLLSMTLVAVPITTLVVVISQYMGSAKPLGLSTTLTAAIFINGIGVAVVTLLCGHQETSSSSLIIVLIYSGILAVGWVSESSPTVFLVLLALCLGALYSLLFGLQYSPRTKTLGQRVFGMYESPSRVS